MIKDENTTSGDLEVSFNSPQCGWMSIGLEDEISVFQTTTAYAPYSGVLAEIMSALSEMLGADDAEFSRTLKWNRDPEEYDLELYRKGKYGSVGIFEYPDGDRDPGKKKNVFAHRGSARQIAEAFYVTFRQLYEEHQIDDFEQNWHQKFPYREYEELKRRLSAV